MGQSASSARCPTTAVSRSSQSPSVERIAAPSERDNQALRSAQTSNSAMASSRRRSFSPDPDSLDSRRSSRIRRRISRFVSSSLATDHTSSTDSLQDVRPIHDAPRPDTENISSPVSRIRLSRIRSSLLHRRRSLNTPALEDQRRNRPSSTAAPQLGPLSFHATRPTGSLDLQHPHALRQRESVRSNSDRADEQPTSRSTDRHLIGSRPGAGSSPERNRYGHPFNPVRVNTHSDELRTHPHSETGGGVIERTRTGDTPLQTSQHQPSPSRTARETRRSSLSSSSRPSRSGEDQAAVLSRLLSVAAAATAASLVGSNVQAFSDARDVSGGSVDGSFEAFLRALQNGRLTSALRSGGSTLDSPDSDMSDDFASSGSIGPLNFFRMFRFGPTSSSPSQSTGTENARMIPVIIVGIRSVNPRDTDIRDGRTSTFLEALSSAPTISDVDSRRSSLASRSRSTHSQSRPGVEGGTHTEEPLSPSTTNPPSVARHSRDHEILRPDPADFSNLSNEASGWNANLESPDLSQRSASPQILDDNVRLSGSSSPDSPRSPTEGTRSWIIYVLGGSYPENHPILTTPSLFTDAPTYEDMMLLSSLIAPVKPPVASREDVESAGGLFRVRLGGTTEATSENGVGDIQLHVGERCLVCLSDFEDGELCRQLVQCQHVFHRDCIDEWLTTGRNSCPLCRGQGVEEVPIGDAAGAGTEADSALSSA
ncbi:hypothetical protein TWF696_001187 [Orbilia brochopaga]|uniref:RING-type domain-containing protein n=1 Tax=Orbilia brochopaga TaxID=3140254 RepID=A0AAV9U8U4_9PEZI